MDSTLRAAAIVAQLPANLAASLTAPLPPEAARRLADVLPLVLDLSREARMVAVRSFLLELSAAVGSSPATLDAAGLSRQCRAHPGAASEVLQGWVHKVQLPKVNLPRRQTAAVILMSLPPEVSAQLFKELGPDEVQAITLEIAKLPQIQPEVRQAIVNEFCDKFGLRSFEGEARSRPEAVAAKINQWIQMKSEAPAAPPPKRRKLEELAPPEPPRGPALRLELPGLLLGSRGALFLQQWVSELGSAWRCDFPPLELVATEGPRVRLRFGERQLLDTEVHPELYLASATTGEQVWILRHELPWSRQRGLRIDTPLKVVRCRMGIALADLVSELLDKGPGLALSDEALVTAAVLRNFHPNELLPELNSLTPEELARVARSYLYCLGLSEDDWEKVLIESAQVSPRELLEMVGLAAPLQDRRRLRHCAVLLRQLDDAEPVWRAFWEQLTLKEGVRVAERMHRLLISPHRTTSPQETFEALSEFSEWRNRSSHHPGLSAPLTARAVVADVPRVWPRLKVRPLRSALAKLPPASLARQLVAYLREPAPGVYLPGPLRAAHLVNSLPDGDAVRVALGEAGYPVPRLPADLEWQARVREEWARRARPVGRN